MKKQLLTTALVATMALTFTACGKDKEQPASSTTESSAVCRAEYTNDQIQ